MSRWMTPASWAAWRAAVTSMTISRARVIGSPLGAPFLESRNAWLSGSPRRYSMTMYGFDGWSAVMPASRTGTRLRCRS